MRQILLLMLASGTISMCVIVGRHGVEGNPGQNAKSRKNAGFRRFSHPTAQKMQMGLAFAMVSRYNK
jgi:hypothetical protein